MHRGARAVDGMVNRRDSFRFSRGFFLPPRDTRRQKAAGHCSDETRTVLVIISFTGATKSLSLNFVHVCSSTRVFHHFFFYFCHFFFFFVFSKRKLYSQSTSARPPVHVYTSVPAVRRA